MTKDDASMVLNHIKKSLMMGDYVTITDDAVEQYHYVLKKFTPKTVNIAVMKLCAEWELRSFPPPITIKRACIEVDGEPEIPKSNHEKHIEEQDKKLSADYYVLKARYHEECDDLRDCILNDKPLTDKQQEGKKQIDICSQYAFGERSIKEELTKGKTAFTVSYFGIYREYLDGTLPKYTGKAQGNIAVTM